MRRNRAERALGLLGVYAHRTDGRLEIDTDRDAPAEGAPQIALDCQHEISRVDDPRQQHLAAAERQEPLRERGAPRRRLPDRGHRALQ